MLNSMRFFGCCCILVVALTGVAQAADPNPPSISSSQGAWPIHRQWTPGETQHYAAWVDNIYTMKIKGNVDQRTGKLERILTDPEMNLLLQPEFLGEGSNPQLPLDIIQWVHSTLDCAKLTAFIPAYYAYRRALPWMTSCVSSGSHANVRSSDFNIPSGSINSFECGSVHGFFSQAIAAFNSGNYRVNINGTNAKLSDTLPVKISREFLMPGCINYIDGHCLVLGKVTEYGELLFLNCSTTPTRDIFTYNGMNVVGGITPRGSDDANEWSGCYQGLRVPRYPIAETNDRGQVIRVRRRTNDEMKEFGFSLEQYDVIQEITREHFIAEGAFQCQSFHDFVRLRMKSVDRIAPLKFLEAYVDDLLEMYKLREDFIQEAWHDVLQNGPIVYPESHPKDNIFQATGRWETWSSPSSDIDRRNKYFYLADWLEYAVRCYDMMPKFVDLTGLEKYKIRNQSDLARALIAEKNRLFASHSMTYKTSKGQTIPLTLTEIEKRLYDMSFDPNHAPELRWGAPAGSDERASAPDRYTPVTSGAKVPMEDAYRWEAFYRTIGQRETEASCLRGMFTDGYPIREKLDLQVGKWIDESLPAPAPAAAEAPKQNESGKRG